jgi:hypothetical protein
MTMREHFAALAMQGLIVYVDEYESMDDLAEAAVEAADALIKALNKERTVP